MRHASIDIGSRSIEGKYLPVIGRYEIRPENRVPVFWPTSVGFLSAWSLQPTSVIALNNNTGLLGLPLFCDDPLNRGEKYSPRASSNLLNREKVRIRRRRLWKTEIG